MSGISVELSENRKPENLLDAQGCVLVLIDFQEKLLPSHYREGKDHR